MTTCNGTHVHGDVICTQSISARQAQYGPNDLDPSNGMQALLAHTHSRNECVGVPDTAHMICMGASVQCMCIAMTHPTAAEGHELAINQPVFAYPLSRGTTRFPIYPTQGRANGL